MVSIGLSLHVSPRMLAINVDIFFPSEMHIHAEYVFCDVAYMYVQYI